MIVFSLVDLWMTLKSISQYEIGWMVIDVNLHIELKRFKYMYSIFLFFFLSNTWSKRIEHLTLRSTVQTLNWLCHALVYSIWATNDAQIKKDVIIIVARVSQVVCSILLKFSMAWGVHTNKSKNKKS